MREICFSAYSAIEAYVEVPFLASIRVCMYVSFTLYICLQCLHVSFWLMMFHHQTHKSLASEWERKYPEKKYNRKNERRVGLLLLNVLKVECRLVGWLDGWWNKKKKKKKMKKKKITTRKCVCVCVFRWKKTKHNSIHRHHQPHHRQFVVVVF